MAKSSTKAKKTPSKKATSPRPHSYRKSSRKPTSRKTPGRDVVKRGEEVEFDAVTHGVVKGKYEGFQGVKVSEDTKKNTISLRLVSNKRGDKRTDQDQVVDFALDDAEELDSYDMIALVKGGEEEDNALEAYEAGSWKCPKCDKSNSNEPECQAFKSYCGGTLKLEIQEITNENGEKEKVKSWTCTKCGNEATDDDSTCKFVNICGGKLVCEEVLGWAGTKVKAILERGKKMWTCDACRTPNPKNTNECLSCHTSKPDSAVGKVAKSLEEATLDGSIGSGGFTFGPAVSNED